MTVMAIEHEKLLSFTWIAPPSLPGIRNQRTFVSIRFRKIDDEHTSLIFAHTGWDEGGEWDKAFEYFSYAWLKVVIPRLKWMLKNGPINWDNPPKF